MQAPSTWEKLEGALERARDRVPTLTTALLIATFCAGAGTGIMVSKPWHRAEINKEWRERLASKSAGVRQIIAQGNAEAEALDDKILAELGVYDDRLAVAEAALENAARDSSDVCRVPAWRLRDK